VDVNSENQNTINKNVNTMGLYWVLSLSSPYHWSHPVSYIITQNLADSVYCQSVISHIMEKHTPHSFWLAKKPGFISVDKIFFFLS